MVAATTLPRTHRGIRTLQEVQDTATAFRRIARPLDDAQSREHGYGGRYAYLSVAPGRIKIGTRKIDTTVGLFGESRLDIVAGFNQGMTPDDDTPKRGKITAWSQKSRNRMRDTLGTLDYSPLFRPGRQLPKMVTLTMPARWETVAPTAQRFKRVLVDKAVKQNFRRHWGYDFVGVWKLEFQRRGAPHLHILTAPPSGTRPGTDETFEVWLRRVWSKACADADTTLEELRDHEAKGVHIEDTYGLTGTDSKRIADYFVKHGVFSAKEYQNTVPDLWADEGPGRFWGYWGLGKADGEAVLGWADEPSGGPSIPGGYGDHAEGGSPRWPDANTYVRTSGRGWLPRPRRGARCHWTCHSCH